VDGRGDWFATEAGRWERWKEGQAESQRGSSRENIILEGESVLQRKGGQPKMSFLCASKEKRTKSLFLINPYQVAADRQKHLGVKERSDALLEANWSRAGAGLVPKLLNGAGKRKRRRG
jgi:hypothetical protein